MEGNMCSGSIVCCVTHGHIWSQTVVMVNNDCATDWRHLFSVFIWLQLSVWMRSINGSTSLFINRVLWWIKAETHLMHHADVSYTWNIWAWLLNRWCVTSFVWVCCTGRPNDIKEITMCTEFYPERCFGPLLRDDGILIYVFWHFASLLARGNGEWQEKEEGVGRGQMPEMILHHFFSSYFLTGRSSKWKFEDDRHFSEYFLL